MSGICGLFAFAPGEAAGSLPGDMARLLERRGPDVTRLWQGGEVALAHCLLATTPEAATEAMLPMLDSARAAHLGRLAILLGETTTQTRNRLGEGELPQMSGLIPVGLPSELLNRRFDIALAEREMAARNQQLGAAIANRYPKLVLTGTPGVSASDLDDLLSSVQWAGPSAQA